MDVAENLFNHDRGFQAEMTALLTSDCDPHAFSDAIARRLPTREAETLRQEFSELPHWLGRTITQHWAMAHAAGKRFELESVRPKDVLGAARDRRVELSVAVDDNAVVVHLSHVATRHADWYATAPLAVAR